MLRKALSLAVSISAVLAAPALAAPPANDAPEQPGNFETFFAPNGKPAETAAIAELAEARPDEGVPRCLGADSFARTVWYRVPADAKTRDITVEATNKTTDLVDLAAFVQPGSDSNTDEPNACSGEGAGASEASEDRTSSVTLRVPANRIVLVQVGQRGPVRSAEDERATLSLASKDLPATARPAGDTVDGAPAVSQEPIALGGATLTEEDPAQPACPSRGSVWRDFGVTQGDKADITVEGDAVGTLTVFQGVRPTGENALACVNRERGGPLTLSALSTTPGQRIWVRLGTDNPPDGATARITAAVGLPPIPATAPPGPRSSCLPRTQGRLSRNRTRVALALAGRTQTARRRNRFRSFPLTVQTFRGPACDVRISVVGPRGRVYASGKATRLAGRKALRLKRTRRLVRGTYRLRVTARSTSGRRVRLITSSKPRLRIR